MKNNFTIKKILQKALTAYTGPGARRFNKNRQIGSYRKANKILKVSNKNIIPSVF